MASAILVSLGQTVSLSPSTLGIVVHNSAVRVTARCSGLDGVAATFWAAVALPNRLPTRPSFSFSSRASAGRGRTGRDLKLGADRFLDHDRNAESVARARRLPLSRRMAVTEPRILRPGPRERTLGGISQGRDWSPSPAAPFLVPMLAIIATALISRAIHPWSETRCSANWRFSFQTEKDWRS